MRREPPDAATRPHPADPTGMEPEDSETTRHGTALNATRAGLVTVQELRVTGIRR